MWAHVGLTLLRLLLYQADDVVKSSSTKILFAYSFCIAQVMPAQAALNSASRIEGLNREEPWLLVAYHQNLR